MGGVVAARLDAKAGRVMIARNFVDLGAARIEFDRAAAIVAGKGDPAARRDRREGRGGAAPKLGDDQGDVAGIVGFDRNVKQH